MAHWRCAIGARNNRALSMPTYQVYILSRTVLPGSTIVKDIHIGQVQALSLAMALRAAKTVWPQHRNDLAVLVLP
jgi:hypothetical protein